MQTPQLSEDVTVESSEQVIHSETEVPQVKRTTLPLQPYNDVVAKTHPEFVGVWTSEGMIGCSAPPAAVPPSASNTMPCCAACLLLVCPVDRSAKLKFIIQSRDPLVASLVASNNSSTAGVDATAGRQSPAQPADGPLPGGLIATAVPISAALPQRLAARGLVTASPAAGAVTNPAAGSVGRQPPTWSDE
jgi:hypothetical protein